MERTCEYLLSARYPHPWGCWDQNRSLCFGSGRVCGEGAFEVGLEDTQELKSCVWESEGAEGYCS